MDRQSIRRTPGKYGTFGFDPSTPVLLLGGKENSLSLARGFGRLGIDVSISGRADCWGLYSRFCTRRFPIPHGGSARLLWEQLLLGNAPTMAERHVVVPCSDDALEFIAANQDELRERHLIDIGRADQILAMLNKQRTLELAAEAGIAHPKFWSTERGNFTIPEEMRFPVLVKPKNTFRFAKEFGRKFIVIDDGIEALKGAIDRASAAGFDVTVVENIPGPDTELSSYYTYVDDDGRCLYDVTKRVIRRYPVNMGPGTCHEIISLPETAREGRKFFRSIGFRGFGCIEFKRDPRDGRLKIMEVNARFTAAQELLNKAGAPIDIFYYCLMTGQEPPPVASYRQGLRFWYPIRDFLAFNQLRRRGELSTARWLRSVSSGPNVHPVLDFGDLRPTVGVGRSTTSKLLARLT